MDMIMVTPQMAKEYLKKHPEFAALNGTISPQIKKEKPITKGV